MALIRTKGTYAKLRKVFTGTKKECENIWNQVSCFDSKYIVTCTRGNNEIMYYRLCNGETVNDKVGMYHYSGNGLWDLYF